MCNVSPVLERADLLSGFSPHAGMSYIDFGIIPMAILRNDNEKNNRSVTGGDVRRDVYLCYSVSERHTSARRYRFPPQRWYMFLIFFKLHTRQKNEKSICSAVCSAVSGFSNTSLRW